MPPPLFCGLLQVYMDFRFYNKHSMEPFRALVADKLPESQRSNGFVIQTLIIGIGTWIASNLLGL
jgi:hypothetical protein